MSTAPTNPFLLDGSIQPIIHYDCGQSDAIAVEMWSGEHIVVVPGYEATYPAPGEVASLVEAMDAAYLDEPAFLAALKVYLVAHGVTHANGPFGLYTLIDRDGYLYAGYGTTLLKFGDASHHIDPDRNHWRNRQKRPGRLPGRSVTDDATHV